MLRAAKQLAAYRSDVTTEILDKVSGSDAVTDFNGLILSLIQYGYDEHIARVKSDNQELTVTVNKLEGKSF